MKTNTLKPTKTKGLALALAFLASVASADQIELINGVNGYTSGEAFKVFSVSPDTAYTDAFQNAGFTSYDTDEIRLFATFQLDGFVPAGATIDAITLSIFQFSVGSAVNEDFTVGLYDITGSPEYGSETWNTSFGPSGNITMGPQVSSFISNPVTDGVPSGTKHTFATTSNFVSIAQSALDSESILNMVIAVPPDQGGGMTSGAHVRYNFSTNGAAQNVRPILTVDYTPIPEPSDALWLFPLVGVAAVLYRRIRKSRS